MGVAKAGRDTAVKAKAALVVNGAFCHCVDHGGGRKVGANGRAAVDSRQQWQRQSSIDQLKVMVASGGIDSHGVGGKQRQSTAIGSKTPMAKTIIVAPPTFMALSLAGGGWQAAVVAARE
jgi:hypothetical protein